MLAVADLHQARPRHLSACQSWVRHLYNGTINFILLQKTYTEMRCVSSTWLYLNYKAFVKQSTSRPTDSYQLFEPVSRSIGSMAV